MVPKLVQRWLWKSIGLALGLSLLVALSALETLLMPGVVRAGETTRVSVDSDDTQGNGESRGPSISDDGRYVAFESGWLPGESQGSGMNIDFPAACEISQVSCRFAVAEEAKGNRRHTILPQ